MFYDGALGDPAALMSFAVRNGRGDASLDSFIPYANSKETFNKLTFERSDPSLVLFHSAKNCFLCEQSPPDGLFLLAAMRLKALVQPVIVDCDANLRLCEILNIRFYPTIVLYRGNAGKRRITEFTKTRNPVLLSHTITMMLNNPVVELGPSNFDEMVNKGEVNWVVDFFRYHHLGIIDN
jgi:hypothetical protein